MTSSESHQSCLRVRADVHPDVCRSAENPIRRQARRRRTPSRLPCLQRGRMPPVRCPPTVLTPGIVDTRGAPSISLRGRLSVTHAARSPRRSSVWGTLDVRHNVPPEHDRERPFGPACFIPSGRPPGPDDARLHRHGLVSSNTSTKGHAPLPRSSPLNRPFSEQRCQSVTSAERPTLSCVVLRERSDRGPRQLQRLVRPLALRCSRPWSDVQTFWRRSP
jgi:hypothetical protein